MHFRYASLGAAAYDPVRNPGGLFLSDVAPYHPEAKVNVGVQYNLALGSLGTVTPRLDDTYTSRIYFDPGTRDVLAGWLRSAERPHDLRAARGKVDHDARRQQPDEQAVLPEHVQPAAASFGILTGQPGMPRNVMLSAKYTF